MVLSTEHLESMSLEGKWGGRDINRRQSLARKPFQKSRWMVGTERQAQLQEELKRQNPQDLVTKQMCAGRGSVLASGISAGH